AHEAEAARDAAEEAWRRVEAILESVTDAFFALDAAWRFTYLNGRAEALLGRPREELIGRVLWEEFPEVADSSFGRAYRRSVETGRKVDLEEYAASIDRWLELHAFPSANGLAVFLQDVTDRMRAEEALRSSEARLAEAQEIARL